MEFLETRERQIKEIKGRRTMQSQLIADIGLRLLTTRKSLKLSQTQFAHALGLSLRAYQTYESGQRSIPAEAVYALHKKFKSDLNWLFSGDMSFELLGHLQTPASSVLEGTLQRLSWLCLHIQEQSGDAFNVSVLAEAIGEETATRLESILAGQEAAPFTLLDTIAAHCKINAVWLKHGIGEPVL